MSEDTTNKNVRDDEIDLLDLFRRIGRTLRNWAHSIGEAILISFIFMLRRWLPLGLSVLIGIALAVLMTNTTKSFYSVDLVLRANVPPTDAIITHINRLHTICTEGDKELLSQYIGIAPDQTKNILDINAFWIIDKGADGIPDYVDYSDEFVTSDSNNVRMSDRFDIRVKIIEPQEMTGVRDGLIEFIKSEPLFQQRNDLRLRQNNELLLRLKTDIELLDSLQNYKYFEESKNLQSQIGGQIVFLQEQKTQLLYDNIYSLYSRKQALEYERDIYNNIVSVMSEFTVPFKRVNDSYFYLKTIVPLFFIVTLILLIAVANKKKIREIYNKY